MMAGSREFGLLIHGTLPVWAANLARSGMDRRKLSALYEFFLQIIKTSAILSV
jgi:hypothetical protein